MATLEQRVAALEAAFRSSIRADPSGKVEVRSLRVREYQDAGEIIRERVMDPRPPPLGNGEDWGDGRNTLYVDSASPVPLDGGDAYEMRWHPKCPEPDRCVAEGADLVGKPTQRNRGGRRWWAVQRRDAPGDFAELALEYARDGRAGRLVLRRVYRDPLTGQRGNPHGGAILMDGWELGPNDWLGIGNQRGSLTVTEHSRGFSAEFHLDHPGLYENENGVQVVRAHPDHWGANSDGGGGDGRIYVGWNREQLDPNHPAYGYRIVNRTVQARIVSWVLRGALTPPI